METEARLNDLLSLWQRRHAEGHSVPAAELCRDCPELAPELERRIRALQEMNRLMETACQRGEDSDVGPGVSQAARVTAEVQLPDLPGYEILGELGRGGMGVVYRARHLKVNRVVALKMIRAGGYAEVEDLKRFHAEAEAVARLQHSNIVQLFESAEHNGLPFFTLEYVPGGSLADRLRGTPLPPQEGARLVEQVARGIQHAHEKAIVHRDLKPGNVLLAADGTPKVADFGLARRTEVGSGLTATGAVLGTPSYMAPEQAAGEAKYVGPTTDVYALGAVLYECLTGRPPFQGPTPLETLLQVLKNEPVPPSQLQPKLPHDLETICLKCLQKEPVKRYGSAVALAEDLRRFQAGEPILARPVGRLERGWRWCRRNPPLAAALTMAVVLLLTGTGVSSYFALAEAEQAATARKNERKAVAARADLAKSNTELVKNRDELEAALGRSLLSPLGLQRSLPASLGVLHLTDQEIEALWELASQRSVGVRNRFVSEALKKPMFTRQLRNRATPALHAAVGLDLGQRKAVEGLLWEPLQQDSVPESQRLDIAFVAAALGDLNPRLAATAVRTLAHAMTKTTDPYTLGTLAEGLAALAVRLESKEAADHCAQAARTLTQAMTKPGALAVGEPLALGLAAVATRLEPEEAAGHRARAARILIQAMCKTNPYALRALPQGLAVLARLDPKEATRAAHTLTQAMTNSTNPYALRERALALATVTARLQPIEAAGYCAQAAYTLTHALTKTTDSSTGNLLAEGLAALVARLPPEEATQAARTLTHALTKTTNPYDLQRLAKWLAAVAAHLEPKEAAGHCAQAAHTFTQAMTNTTNPLNLGMLAQGLAALAARLPPEEATQAARTLTHAMAKTTDPFALGMLAQGLAALAARLGPEEATQAVRILTQAKTTDPLARGMLAQGLAVLAAHLPPEEATQAARTLTHALTKTTNSDYLRPLAEGLAAVAAHLEPKEAAGHCAQAAHTFTQAMTNTTNPFDLERLAQGLAAVAAYLERNEAARTLTQAMTKATNLDALKMLAQRLSGTLTGDARDPPARAAGLVAALGAPLPGQPLQAPIMHLPSLEPLPCRLSTQEFVDLLKHPFCVGQARRVVLDQLENRYRRRFADHWEFVRYATEQRLGLDFTTPPRRPEPPAPEMRK
jgi:hypothetical protein